jgi:hypothetical protein
MSYFVQRDAGVVVGLFDARQPGFAEEFLPADHPDVAAFLAPAPPPPTYRDLRKQAYLTELSTATSADPLDAIGDTLDALIAELRARGAPASPEFTAIAAKVDAIKARFPKPN